MYFKTSLTAIAVACGLASLATPASAGLITYDSYSVVNNTNVTIDYVGISPGPYGSGQINTYIQGNLVATSWCIDVSHDLEGSGSWNVVDAVENTSNSLSNIDNAGGTGALLSWQTLGELGALAEYGNVNINSNSNLSAAVQLAIWDVEYGSSITTTSDSSAVQALAKALVFDAKNGRIGSDTDVAWLMYCNGNACNQGQLEVLGGGDFHNLGNPFDTPEPSTFAVLVMALLSFSFYGGRKLRSTF